MCIERPRGAGYADLPIDLRVVRLELLVRDRPVGEPGATDRSPPRTLVEVARAEPPVIRGVVYAAAAHAPAVRQQAPGVPLRRFGFCRSVRLNRLGRDVEQLELPLHRELVVR